jgi:hypothetical protein
MATTNSLVRRPLCMIALWNGPLSHEDNQCINDQDVANHGYMISVLGHFTWKQNTQSVELRTSSPSLATLWLKRFPRITICRTMIHSLGNLCTVGQFVSLPIVETPDGPRGSDLAITLALHKPHQEPCFDLLAPKSTLISFPSPICQIATLPLNSGTEEFEGNPLRLSFDIDRPFRH